MSSAGSRTSDDDKKRTDKIARWRQKLGETFGFAESTELGDHYKLQLNMIKSHRETVCAILRAADKLLFPTPCHQRSLNTLQSAQRRVDENHSPYDLIADATSRASDVYASEHRLSMRITCNTFESMARHYKIFVIETYRRYAFKYIDQCKVASHELNQFRVDMDAAKKQVQDAKSVEKLDKVKPAYEAAVKAFEAQADKMLTFLKYMEVRKFYHYGNFKDMFEVESSYHDNCIKTLKDALKTWDAKTKKGASA